MLVSFLFWNMGNRPLQERLAKMVRAHDIDVVMLAECAVSPNDVETMLIQETRQTYHFAEPNTLSKPSKIHIFSRLGRTAVRDQFRDEAGRMTIRRLKIDGVPDTLLAVVHLPSRVNSNEGSQAISAPILMADIEKVEQVTTVSRTIFVGDFNMNPFDIGMASAGAFHAVMSKQTAERGSRKVQGRTHRFFYNPMWGHFGDRTLGPQGTYYWSSANELNHFWNMYDQVLLRPDLMHSLRDLQILDSDSETSLLTPSGLPDKIKGSDHLPIYFQLEL